MLWKRLQARDARKELDFFLSVFPGCCHSQCLTLHALWAASGPAKMQNFLFRFLSIHSKGTPPPQEHGSLAWRDVKPPLLCSEKPQVVANPGARGSWHFVRLWDPAPLGSPQHPASVGAGRWIHLPSRRDGFPAGTQLLPLHTSSCQWDSP